MNILYSAHYQGSDIINQRKMKKNRALGGTRKIELISRMIEKQGHDVTILSGGIPAERSGRFYQAFTSTTDNSQCVRVLYAAGWDMKIINHLWAIMSSIKCLIQEKEKFDALIIYNIDEFTWSVTWFYWRFIGKVPIILEYEDSVDVVGRGTNRFRRTIWKLMEKWLCGRLRGVISVNSILGERLKIPNTYVLRGIINEEMLQAVRGRSTPLSGKPPYLALFCGSLISGKGANLIPEIAPQFKGRVKFIIAGDGPLKSQLAIAAQNCGGDVDVVGYLTNQELYRMYGLADILINPHDNEPSGGILPFKLLEYLASGGIVISTRSDAQQQEEIFDYCQVMQPKADHFAEVLEHILAHPKDAAERAKLGQSWAILNYSEKTVSKALCQLISMATNP